MLLPRLVGGIAENQQNFGVVLLGTSKHDFDSDRFSWIRKVWDQVISLGHNFLNDLPSLTRLTDNFLNPTQFILKKRIQKSTDSGTRTIYLFQLTGIPFFRVYCLVEQDIATANSIVHLYVFSCPFVSIDSSYGFQFAL